MRSLERGRWPEERDILPNTRWRMRRSLRDQHPIRRDELNNGTMGHRPPQGSSDSTYR